MKKYRIRESAPPEVHEELHEYSLLIRNLLHSRGISTKEDTKTFLEPSYDFDLHDPFLLSGMEGAVSRILGAMEKGEAICIYSDYDHDGIPGGVLLKDFFEAIQYKSFRNYIPHRHQEGYGLNAQAVRSLAEEGVTLIITVDCGITDSKAVAVGNKLGVDTIITDHHLPPKKLPESFATVNPKLSPNYPFDGLCGAGVAWKLVSALIQKGNFSLPEGYEKWLLDLAGLSTIADMVPLRGENRVIAHFGLKVLRKTRRPGLRALYRVLRLDPSTLTEDDVGFSLAPRINAASRMDTPQAAFDTLAEKDPLKAYSLAENLHKLNDSRKGHTAAMVKEAKQIINNRLKEKEILSPLIVLGSPSWRPGLLGLAANSMVEAYSRPAFLWGREGGEGLKGSCRSDGVVDVVELMRATRPGVFKEFGGHKFSGGFSVKEENIHHLDEELHKAYETFSFDGVLEEAWLDGMLSLDEVDNTLLTSLERLAPFGVGNPKPLFLFSNVTPEKARLFGARKDHLELQFRKNNGEAIRAISFFAKGKNFSCGSVENIESRKPYSLVGNIERSNFGGRSEIRLRIEDILS